MAEAETENPHNFSCVPEGYRLVVTVWQILGRGTICFFHFHAFYNTIMPSNTLVPPSRVGAPSQILNPALL